jgi:Zn-dependent M28 family amino/carboxypeptidase
MRPFSPRINGTFDIVKLDTSLFRAAITEEQKNNLADKIGSYDTTGWGNKWFQYFFRSKSQLPYKGTVQIIDGVPGFSASTRTGKQAMLMINRIAFPADAKKIEIDIEAKMINHRALNVIGILPGETDSLIVFTGHYDHLGGFGNKAFFPGANDNASGTAMVLDMARECSKQSKHKYSYAFMLFSGEEAGLLGSYNYTANPTIPLDKIKMLFNLDMVGTGIDGVSIFNGNTHPKEYALLDSINKVNSFNLKLSSKGISANSDIYPFYKKGVKGFFLLTNDKNAPYHTVTDTYDKLSFQSYEKLVKLIKAYINTL